MQAFFQKNFKLLLIPIICSMIILSWFYQGKIISNTSEEQLSIYHPQNDAKNYSNFWFPPGIGQKGPFQFVKFPVFYGLGLLEHRGMPAFLRQALLLWLLMVAGVFFMFLLLRRGFEVPTIFSLVGGFFYLLNIYSMTQVWKRFLYHGMFAWVYLPLFLLLWIEWVNSKKFIWLFFFLFSSFFFTYSFTQPANLITIWVPAGIFTLVQIWQYGIKTKEAKNILIKSIIGLVLWCLVNIWWLYPELYLGSTWTQTTGETLSYNLNSLQTVSRDFPIWEILLLRQGWYLSPKNDFGGFYQNIPIIFISILILYFVILAVVKLREFRYRSFVLVLGFVGFFVSKGANFPFGNAFFYLLFSNLNFTTAFRNPYEKFGIVWLLVYTILFTLGFSRFLSSLKANKPVFLGGVILFLILVLVFPFWSGGVFPQKHRLNVPKYYDEANDYLNQQSSDRLFHIPFLLELENLTYSWGFVGGDPTPALFNLETITAPKKPLYYQISLLLPKYLSNKQFPKILGLLGVGNVIVHKESVYPTINLKEMTKNIENWADIQNKKEIGELVIYSLDKEIIKPRVYAAISSISVNSIEEMLGEVMSGNVDTKKEVFMIGDNTTPLTASTKASPQIIFNKLSNDHFLVVVNKATLPFILVFNNTFDKSWQLRIDNQIIDKHFIVNGFANGWLIDKKGDYKLDIKLKVWPWD
ncbi:hypothetical protein HYW41_02015 [Candidatus Daviesbacteria bacterium]|nr:hypothetical protein [Candidatus Daviesbacteria bacterium]